MIERVAIAMWLHAGERALGRPRTAVWEEWDENDKTKWREQARTAIAALREPTGAMWQSARPFMDSESSNGAWWRAMIDAALEEPKP